MEEFYDRAPEFNFCKAPPKPFRYLFDSQYSCNNIVLPTYSCILKLPAKSIAPKNEVQKTTEVPRTTVSLKDERKVYSIELLRSIESSPLAKEKPKLKSKYCSVIVSKCRDAKACGRTRRKTAGRSFGLIEDKNAERNAKNLPNDCLATAHHNKTNKQNLDLIHVKLNLKENIELQSSSNAWKPNTLRSADCSNRNKREPEQEGSSVMDNNATAQRDKVFEMKIRGILNKITAKNLESLAQKILSIEKMNAPSKIECMLDQILEKAIDESKFSNIYAKLCKELESIDCNRQNGGKQQNVRRANTAKTFRSILLHKIDIGFASILGHAQDESKDLQKVQDDTDAEDIESKERRRSCGIVNFIGELFNISLIDIKVIQTYMQKLLQPFSERKLEYLCKLLLVIGKKYERAMCTAQMADHDSATLSVKFILKEMHLNVGRRQDGVQISSRVKFILQDVVDLHEDNWIGKDDSKNQPHMVYNDDDDNSSRDDLNASFSSRKDILQQEHQQHKNNNYSSRKRKTYQANDNRREKQNAHKPLDKRKILKNIKFDLSVEPVTLGARSQFTSFFAHSSSKSVQKPSDEGNRLQQDDDLKGNAVQIGRKLIFDLIESAKSRLITDICHQWDDIPKRQHFPILCYILSEFIHYSEVTKRDRAVLSNIIALQCTRKKLDNEVIVKAFEDFFSISSDIVIDVPKMWQYLFDCLAALLFRNILKLDNLIDTKSSDLNRTQYFVMLYNCIRYYASEKGTNFIKYYWWANKNMVEEKFRSTIWNEFFDKYKDLRFLRNLNSYTFESDDKLDEKNEFVAYEGKEDFKKLEEFVATIEEKNNSESHSQLVRLLCDFTLKYDKIDSSYSFDHQVFNNTVIRDKLIKSLNNNQLRTLYAVELYYENLNIFRNNICGMLNELLKWKIIDKAEYRKWQKSRSNNSTTEQFINFPLTSEVDIYACVSDSN